MPGQGGLHSCPGGPVDDRVGFQGCGAGLQVGNTGGQVTNPKPALMRWHRGQQRVQRQNSRVIRGTRPVTDGGVQLGEISTGRKPREQAGDTDKKNRTAQIRTPENLRNHRPVHPPTARRPKRARTKPL